MRCLKLNKVLIAAYAAHHLSQPEAERVEAHLGTCNSCRRLAEDLERSSVALQELKVEPSDDRLRQIRARVLDRISAQEQLPERTAIWRWPAGRQWVVGWKMAYVAAIAVVLSVGALLFWNSLRHHSTGPLGAQMHVQTRPQPSTQTPPDTRAPERSFKEAPPPDSAAVSPRKDRSGPQSGHSSSRPGISLPSPVVVAEAPHAITPTGITPARDLPYPSPAMPAPPAPTMGTARPEAFGRQDQAPKGSLLDQLQAQYPLTKLSADGKDVVTAGSVFTLKKDGLVLTPTDATDVSHNSYKAGRITQGAIGKANEKANKVKSIFGHFPLPGASSTAAAPTNATRTFVEGEKVNITKIEVKDGSVVFDLCSAKAYSDVYYHGSLTFPVDKGTVPAADAMLATSGEVFSVDSPEDTKAAPAAPQTGAGGAPAEPQTTSTQPPDQAATPGPRTGGAMARASRSGGSGNSRPPSLPAAPGPATPLPPGTGSATADTGLGTNREIRSVDAQAILARPARDLGAGLNLGGPYQSPADRLRQQLQLTYMTTIMEPNGARACAGRRHSSGSEGRHTSYPGRVAFPAGFEYL